VKPVALIQRAVSAPGAVLGQGLNLEPWESWRDWILRGMAPWIKVRMLAISLNVIVNIFFGFFLILEKCFYIYLFDIYLKRF
jgi:hypothetical protein